MICAVKGKGGGEEGRAVKGLTKLGSGKKEERERERERAKGRRRFIGGGGDRARGRRIDFPKADACSLGRAGSKRALTFRCWTLISKQSRNLLL